MQATAFQKRDQIAGTVTTPVTVVLAVRVLHWKVWKQGCIFADLVAQQAVGFTVLSGNGTDEATYS